MISPVIKWVASCTGLESSLSGHTLEEWQLEKVRRLIEYARSNSTFYASRLQNINTDKISSFGDMQRLPFTCPEEVIHDPNVFLCVPQRDISRIVTLPTSGSQGIPKRIYFTEADLERTIDFFACGMSTMVENGQRVLVLMSGKTKYSIGDLLQKGLARIGVETDIHGTITDMTAAAEAARDADCLVGIPGEVIGLCRNHNDLRPRSVLLSADYVPDSIIRGIEETWKCRVFTHYGMTETGFGGGVQCEAREGYHLRDADLLYEIVDPETGLQVPEGSYGEVVVTTLTREAMPLIRYRTGDIARMRAGACSCGGILPCMDKVTGRLDNIISMANGKYISINDLDEIMYARPEIYNYSARFVNKENIPLLELTVNAGPNSEGKQLSEYLKGLMQYDISIEVRHGQPVVSGATLKRRIYRD